MDDANIQYCVWQFASWRKRANHAKKSAPSQQHNPQALSESSGILMVAANS
jgi:hypothetical protein